MAAQRSSFIAAVLAGVLMLALVAVPAPVAVAQASGGGPPEIVPPDGQCALRTGNDLVTFRGSVAKGSTLQKVVFEDLDANENQIGSDRDITPRNAVSIDSEGVISGTTFAGGTNFPSNSEKIRAVLTIALGDTTVDYVTSPVRVDRIKPTFAGARTTGTKTVVVEFSEAVSSADGDFAGDWAVAGEIASKIGGAGATRTLEVSLHNIGEDERPTVEYSPLPSHGGYKDCAGNSLSFAAGLSRQAVDGIAPRIPRITQIASKDAASTVSTRDDTPSVAVDTATNGHKIVLYRESTNTPSFDPDEDIELGTATVSGGSATFDGIPSVGSDGTYTLYALAIDVNGNPSRDAGGNVAADPATFRLDRLAPKVLDARTTGSRVTVTFSEALVGGNNAGDWTITGCPVTCSITGVSGSGDTRALAIAAGGFVPNGAKVAWTRPAANGYDDEAGNPLASFDSLATQGLIPKVMDLEPETGTSTVGESYALKATVTDEFGSGVSGSVVGLRATTGPSSRKDFDGNGPNPPGVIGSCFTQADGGCEITYSSNAADLDELQAWIDTDGNPATFEALSPEDRDESHGDFPNQDVVEVAWSAVDAALQLDASPEEAQVPLGQPHVVTMTVTARDGIGLPSNNRALYEDVLVGLRSIGGPNDGKVLGSCETKADGTCKVSYISAVKGDDRLQAWIDRDKDGTVAGDDLFAAGNEGPDADGRLALDDPVQDVIDVTWAGTAILHLNLEPEHQSLKLKTSAPLSLSVLDDGGEPVEGMDVDLRVVSGPNAGKHMECVTEEDGACATGYDSSKVGTDSIQGWIDTNGNDLADEPTKFEGTDEGLDGGDPVQDSVTIEWIVEGLHIDATPETATVPIGAKIPLQAAALDSDGRGVEAIPVAARVIGGELLGSCATGADGTCRIDLLSRRVGQRQVQVWIDLNRDGAADEASTPEPATETGTDQANQDVVQANWVLEGADLIADGTPETTIAKVGAEKSITLSAADTATNRIAGVPMGARVISGPNSSKDIGACVTQDDGTCALAYSSDKSGTDLVLVWVDTNGDRSSNEVSGQPEPRGASGAADVHNHDVIEVTWGPHNERLISIAKPSTKAVRFRAPVTLHGEVGGDGSCRNGAAVELQQRVVGANGFSTIAKVRSGSGGAWSVTFHPRFTATYRAVAQEDASCSGAKSDTVPVPVKAKVVNRIRRSEAGSCATVQTRVRPRHPHGLVELQRRTARGWKSIAHRKLSKRSRTKFRICSTAPTKYRVLKLGDALNERSASRTFRLS